MTNQRVIGLDLATLTGICIGEPDEIPTLSHVRHPSTGEDVGRFLDHAEAWARCLIESQSPALVVFEAPILPQTTSLATIRKLQGLAGVVEMAAYRAGIETAEVQPSTVKKALTGHGGTPKGVDRKDRKKAMVAACRAYGFDPKVDDEADAFGVWLATVRIRFPRCAFAWDPINFSGLRP